MLVVDSLHSGRIGLDPVKGGCPLKSLWRPYAATVVLVAATTLLGRLVLSRVDPTNLVMLYLLAVVVTGLRWGRSPAVLSAVLGVLSFDYFLVPPYLTMAVSDAQYLITFFALLAVALVIGTLTGQLRDHAAELHRREAETAALYAFSRSMAIAQDLPAVAQAVVQHVSGTFGRPATLLLQDQAGPLAEYGWRLTPAERQTAAAALGQDGPGDAACASGAGETSQAGAVPVPLTTAHGVVGVVCLAGMPEVEPLSPDRRRLLAAFAVQAAGAVERAQLAEAAQRAHLLEETEKLQDALLHSISHALRTPLASIIGSLSTLSDSDQLNEETRTDLLDTAREEADRLNWLVSNLLDMTRLESGHLTLTVDRYDLEDVVGVALGQTASILRERPVDVRLEENLPLVPLDQVLIVQVLDNLLSNAAKYSPTGSPIDIGVRREGQMVEVSVADRGFGIPERDRERVFEKFYRVQRPGNPSGTGLGLAICRGIVEAHRGRIWAEDRQGGGTTIRFTLPLEEGKQS